MNEKLNELLKDESVVKELLEQETAEDAQKFLASKGVEISIEDLEEIQKILAAQSDEEMDDGELENVAGGVSLETVDNKLRNLNLSLEDLGVINRTVFNVFTSRRW